MYSRKRPALVTTTFSNSGGWGGWGRGRGFGGKKVQNKVSGDGKKTVRRPYIFLEIVNKKENKIKKKK